MTREKEHISNNICTSRQGRVNNPIITAEVHGARTTHNGTHACTPDETVKLGTVITAVVEAVRRRTGCLNLLLARII